MNRVTNIDKKVNDALGSLDGLQRATTDDWFYTRVQARLQKDKTVWASVSNFLSRPVVAIATLALILVANGVVLFQQKEIAEAAASANIQTELNTDNEYVLASSSSYEYENIVQQ